ncbi:MAG: T9SS C-terminal target domain-containing protein [Chlorobi bacterium]|nr:T9SS C-terminal target domain-containing protein [Chlorobiota bacterium]
MTHLQHLPLLAWSVLAVLLLPQISNAQQNPPVIEWQKTLGGSGRDRAYSIAQTSDGGYIVAGVSWSKDGDVTENHGSSESHDYWIVKLTNTGELDWQRSLGGSEADIATSIAQTNDGGYIVAGWSASTDGDVTGHHGSSYNYDYWIVKLTGRGAIQWETSLGGSSDDLANLIVRTTDGGYIVAGGSSSDDGDVTGHHGVSDYWLVKLTITGAIQWQKSLGGSNEDWANSIQQTSDGGYIVAGWSISTNGDVTSHHGSLGNADYWIVKLTNTGVIEWQKTLGGSRHDVAYSITQAIDRGYIVAGYSYSNNGDVTGHHGSSDSTDYWIVKLTETGVIEWEKSLGGSNDDVAESIVQTRDGGYIVAGGSGSTDGGITSHHGLSDSTDYWIVKLSSVGAIQWQKSFGGSREDCAYSIAQTRDSGHIIAGFSNSTDGDVTGSHGDYDSWIVKLAPPTSDVQQEPTATLAALTILPNPAHTTAMLKIQTPAEAEYTIELILPLGEVVKRQSAQLGLGEQTVPLTNLESLPAGSYEVIVAGGGKQVAHSRLVLLGE